MYKRQEGVTILLVEQNARQALLLSHRGYVLQTGHMVQELSLIHISEPTRLLSISYAVFCLKKKMPSLIPWIFPSTAQSASVRVNPIMPVYPPPFS